MLSRYWITDYRKMFDDRTKSAVDLLWRIASQFYELCGYQIPPQVPGKIATGFPVVEKLRSFKFGKYHRK